MVSMMNILAGATPLIVDVRRTGSGPNRHSPPDLETGDERKRVQAMHAMRRAGAGPSL